MNTPQAISDQKQQQFVPFDSQNFVHISEMTMPFLPLSPQEQFSFVQKHQWLPFPQQKIENNAKIVVEKIKQETIIPKNSQQIVFFSMQQHQKKEPLMNFKVRRKKE